MDTALHGLAYAVQTFGCQMNKHDSERVCGLLESCGCTPAETVEASDILVYITCCVREAADERLYGQVASVKNIPPRPGSPLSRRLIAIGGCVGQRDGAALIDRQPHIDVVFGTNNLSALPRLLENALDNRGHQVEVLAESAEFSSSLPGKRERQWSAWLPITTGCDNFCSYCIVPYVRGREKSRPLEDIVSEARHLVEEGVREITLLGQNVNSYGRDLYGKPAFVRVLHEVNDTGIARLRFATSHPKDLSDDVIDAFATLPSLMPALHLPVQSGSDRILKSMNRRYTRDHYERIVDKLRTACPDIALSTDCIVGYPGETEEDFAQTYDLIDRIGYNQVFTFIYSKREGTPAARLRDDTPREVVQERFDRLVDLVQARAYESNQAEYGRTVPVLVEGPSKRDPLMASGKSPKNQTVHFPVASAADLDALIGTITDVRILEAKTWYLRGERIS